MNSGYFMCCGQFKRLIVHIISAKPEWNWPAFGSVLNSKYELKRKVSPRTFATPAATSFFSTAASIVLSIHKHFQAEVSNSYQQHFVYHHPSNSVSTQKHCNTHI
ncbi:hypothetical protein TRVL_09764 [Trypanosoma vivax]|nr:hypothetical protein TRVL_09764 [Trypanosoma vivax]